MIQELEVLQELVHPQVMGVQEILHDKDNFYVVAELCSGGELYDRISQIKIFNEGKAAYLLKQVLLAVNYMHQRNIVHRDLKPENILLESPDLDKLEIKITDFGFSCFFDPKKGLDLQLGSPLYMAPEVVLGQ